MKSGDAFITTIIILMIVLAASLLVLVSCEKQSEWQVSAGEKILSAAADGDSIYLLTGDPATSVPHTLYSVARDGEKEWEIGVQDLRHVPDQQANIQGQIVSVSSTTVYVYLYEEGQNFKSGVLHAISPTGKIMWTLPYYMDLATPSSICECKGLVYIYVGPSKPVTDPMRLYVTGREIVTDQHGKVCWTIADLAASPTISPDGYVYAMIDNSTETSQSSSINAYYPNGTLYWSKSFNHSVIDVSWENSLRDYYLYTRGINWLDISGIEQTVPVYHNDTIYLVYYDEIMAFDQAGNVIWSMPIANAQNTSTYASDRYVPYWPVLFDSEDDFYALRIIGESRDLLKISPNGDAYAVPYNSTKDYRAAKGNLVYYVTDSPENYWAYQIIDTDEFWSNPVSRLVHPVMMSPSNKVAKPDFLENLSAITVTWDDVSTGRTVACVTLPITCVRWANITADNVYWFFEPGQASDICTANAYNGLQGDILYNILNSTTPVNIGRVYIDILPSDNLTYISLYEYNSQDPVTFGKTKIYYSSAIYAVDRDGRILWTKSIDFGADLIDADNTTVYYSTNNGRISSAGMYVAGGVTLAGILYAVLKFFSAGVVSRARSRIDKNDNRNAVLQFVIGHPGSTLRDIARGMEVNLGTIRYHTYILSLNHKLVSFKSDGKYVRYFQNSNTYSREEQLILSLAKRDKLRYLLKKIAEQPGMSNRELAHALDLKESAVSRYMKELAGEGIVEKVKRSDSCTAYSVNDRYKKYVESAISMAGS